MRPQLRRLESRPDLTEYGIEIPLEASRADQVVSSLERYGVLPSEHFKIFQPLPLTAADLRLAHTEEFVRKIFDQTKAAKVIESCYEIIGPNGSYHRYNPSSASRPLFELAMEQVLEASASFEASKLALDEGFCYFLGGGMHHARKDGPSGFCLINDIVVSIRKLQAMKKIRTAWVIDTDAHKGDGTAEITFADDSIKTLSIHMSKGWPLDQSSHYDLKRAPWCASDVDIGVGVGEEAEYLKRLAVGLVELLNESDGRLPDLAIVVNGSDPYKEDVLPSTLPLQLGLPELLQRDMLVYNFLKTRNVPQTWLMAGGYGHEVYQVHAQFLKEVLS